MISHGCWTIGAGARRPGGDMDTREFLKDLVRSREDRSAPIHFAGRQDEIGLILSRAYRMGDDESAGLTVIVQGAPGVGKTALLNEVSKRFRDEAARRVALYMRSPWAKEDEPGTLRRLAGAMFGQTPDDFTTTSTTVKRGGVSALGRAELSLTSSKVPPDIRSWADFDEVYANRIADARRVLVVVDEGQLFEPDANRMLVRFHTQAAYPILLVIGGLGDTRDKLEDLGLSRVGGRSVMNIGALPAADEAEAVRETLASTLERCTAPPVRWTRKQFDAWCVALAALSQGWPQHITCVIQGVWLALAGAHRLELSTENLGYLRCPWQTFFCRLLRPQAASFESPSTRCTRGASGAAGEQRRLGGIGGRRSAVQ